MSTTRLTPRRGVLRLVAGVLGGAAIPFQAVAEVALETHDETTPLADYRDRNWRDHFARLDHGAILIDCRSRVLHYWPESGGDALVLACSVPLERARRRPGLTRVIRKVEGPIWHPTRAERLAHPELAAAVPVGPDNPLGTHAIHLAAPEIRIHGSAEGARVGIRSRIGGFGLCNDDIARLFDLVMPGTQVRLI